ncbi:hypothetical protein [Flavobacterium sp. LC2016-01]|uniref:hypothetical protein n=1 Tax=Flavobacterium sp. LC2016-01 TaxID=2675876 RepID=UPI0012BB1185|nr:hypothetical protein [Flavobacterium sp. LC2016-01]MTH14282.1 hypothetical protein [Flavobacterium sp. LC2016-01]
MNRRDDSAVNNLDVSPYVMTQEQAEAIADQKRVNTKIVQFEKNRFSNNLFYSDYAALDSLTVSEQEEYGVCRLKKDSLIFMDIKSQLNIPKEYYLQNNHDDSLRVAFKSPRNLTIFIHDFETKESVENGFKSVKRYSNLEKFKVENNLESAKVFSYKISKEGKKFNGYALAFQSKTRDYQTFYEFESSTLSKDMLKNKALEFLIQNTKQKK